MFVRLLILAGGLACVSAAGCATKPPGHPYKFETLYFVSDPEFERTMGHLLGPPLVGGNRITKLINGDEIFPAMLEAVRGAQRTINFETYVYWSGDVARQFADALAERAEAGVTINIILDAYGAGKMPAEIKNVLRRPNIKIVYYHPLSWYMVTAASKLNNRTHRKLLIVDGRVGFTGGLGIAEEWSGNAQDERHWRDNHFRVEGPVVAHLQSAFTDNWIEATGEILHGEDYYPAQAAVGPTVAQVFKSGPEGGSASMQLMYLMSFAAAAKSIDIGSPYFVPDTLTIRTLQEARKRGVRVRIIVPGPHMDQEIVTLASRRRWGELLDAGVEIYTFQPTMYHCKLMIVDERWVSIGSANMDNRSFSLNDEANLNVLDNDFAAEMTRVFEADLLRCHKVSQEKYENRSWWHHLWENSAGLLESQL